jgi:hypothetical protein
MFRPLRKIDKENRPGNFSGLNSSRFAKKPAIKVQQK